MAAQQHYIPLNAQMVAAINAARRLQAIDPPVIQFIKRSIRDSILRGSVADLSEIDFPQDGLWGVHGLDRLAISVLSWLFHNIDQETSFGVPIPQAYAEDLLQQVTSGGAGLVVDMVLYSAKQLHIK
jgi:hypothetical protein